ncbi:hypothetical protein SprV_0802464400 [Sparganum proliferum]
MYNEMQEQFSVWNIHRHDQNQRYEIIPTEIRPLAEGSETSDTYDGSAASEVEISIATERAFETGSPGVTDAGQVKGRHSINQARKYAPTLYTIEEVSTEQEEEEEEEYFEDIEEEEEDAEENETEKMRHDGLSEGKEEEEQGKAKEMEDKEEEKREHKVAEREKQTEEGNVVEEEERAGNENTGETGQNVDGKENKEEDAEAKEMTQSKLDAKRYTQLSANILDSSHRKMKTESTLVSQTGKYAEDGETSISGDVSQHLTRAERWAMRRHVELARRAVLQHGRRMIRVLLQDCRSRIRKYRQRIDHQKARCCEFMGEDGIKLLQQRLAERTREHKATSKASLESKFRKLPAPMSSKNDKLVHNLSSKELTEEQMQVLRHEASFNTADAKPTNMISAVESILS